ncbi:MAG: Spy/CpxP family protein refolding chaperone [Myxococcota bacterium]|nr:Spy/CpxP family protein refolding chaperone [Myxococcota bacterium]
MARQIVRSGRRRSRGYRAAGFVAALLLAWSPPAPAEPPDGPPGGPPPHGGPPRPHGPPPPEAIAARYGERLGLDEEALARIRGISEETRSAHEQLRAELEAAHQDMRALLSQEVPNESEVMQQAERIGTLETRNRQLRLRAMLAIRALLSDEQRAELVRMRGERRPGEPRPRGGPLGPCSVDLAELCPESRPGRAALRCLANRWDDVSRPCRRFVQHGPPPR